MSKPLPLRNACTCPGDDGSVPTPELAYGYAKDCPLHGWTDDDPPISQDIQDLTVMEL